MISTKQLQQYLPHPLKQAEIFLNQQNRAICLVDGFIILTSPENVILNNKNIKSVVLPDEIDFYNLYESDQVLDLLNQRAG